MPEITKKNRENTDESLSLSVSGKGGKYVINARSDEHKTYKISSVSSKADRIAKGGVKDKPEVQSIAGEADKRKKMAAFIESQNSENIRRNTVSADSYEETVTEDNYSAHFTEEKTSEEKKPFESRYFSESKPDLPAERERAISPEMEKRMKIATFMEQKNSKSEHSGGASSCDTEKNDHTQDSYTAQGEYTQDGYTEDYISDSPAKSDTEVRKPDKKPFESKFISEKKTDIPAERGKVITPEMARRMKVAAYMAQRNSEAIRQNRAAAYSDTAQTAAPQEAPLELFEKSEKKSPQETVNTSHISESAIPEAQRTITPEMAERLKRAAYLEQRNSEAIRINRATAFEEKIREEAEEARQEVLEEPEKQEAETEAPRRSEDNPETVSDNEADIRRYKAGQAYAGYIGRKKAEKKDGESKERKESGIDRLSRDFQTAADIAKGDVQHLAGNAVRNGLSEETNAAVDSVSTVSGSVKNADSVGSAVMDVSTTLAAVEAKKMLKKLAETDVKKSERAKDRAAHNGNRYGIGKYDEVTKKESAYKSAEQIKAEKYADEPKGKIRAGNSHKMREEKKEYAKKQKSKQIRNKRKELYLRDNPGALKELVNGTVSGRELLKGALKKKATSLIVGGGVGAIVTPILLIIIVFILISAFFSWLSPFSYTLAGEDGTEHSAGTKAEVIDGYTLMIKNYMDVAQAEFYLTYGDWYGGTYNYPAPSLDFSTFFTEYTQNLTDQIRAMYQPLIDAATNPYQIQALTNAMQSAITNAVNNAYPAALAEYNALMASLDDTMTPTENRQPYEVSVTSGANGTADSAEFTGKPVVGTNLFGNVEINSDLSAEELLAYVALYKSLKLMDTSDPAEGEEISLNITPQDINDFFKDTEFFSITAEITENHTCSGANCKRRLVSGAGDSYEWEYYCDNDHKNLTGEIGACKTADELLLKIMELTNAEDIGVDEESCKSVIDSYIDMFKEELNVTEDDFRGFGAADNTTAQEFYKALIDGSLENADIWDIETPLPNEE